MADNKQNVIYSSEDGKFNDKTQIKMWETEIIMHLQTLKQARKAPKANSKSIAQVQKAIEENLMKIRQINPSYELPHTEDNIEDEIHSGFDPKNKDSHTEDTKGINSKYSGEKVYKEEHPESVDMNQATKDFLEKLKKSNEDAKKEDKEAVAVFDKIHNIKPNESDVRSIDEVVEEVKNDTSLNSSNIKTDVNVEYDLVPLPSNGECYKNKKKRLSVSYLTAYDENMITSPNLYEGNLISEFLLKNKILDKDVDIMDLTLGDADAILVWLRKTGYGNEYSVTVNDRESGKDFNTTVDLNEITMADFKLKGDENGLFDYHCDVCGADIKFRFLTLADSKAIGEKLSIETEDVRKNYISVLSSKIANLLNDDKELSSEEKNVLESSLEVINQWTGSKSKENYNFSNSVTDTLERLIYSVNGNSDRTYIKKFISRMPALDSLKFRKYVNENEPHMNFEVTITKPADLGGGQMKTFLRWDKYVFANTSVV